MQQGFFHGQKLDENKSFDFHVLVCITKIKNTLLRPYVVIYKTRERNVPDSFALAFETYTLI